MKKKGRLQDKVALITCASGGQGLVEAELFAAEGAAVILADISDRPGKALARTIVTRGGRVGNTSTSTLRKPRTGRALSGSRSANSAGSMCW